MKILLYYSKLFATLLFGGILFVLLANIWIIASTKKNLYNDVAAIPKTKTALVLGTNPILSNGNTNLYFTYRINKAAELYHAGKVEYLLVSGDNQRYDYNEPEHMRDALIKQGVPAERIYLDYAGFRTFDSVVRAKVVFGQDNMTIVSQPFHNQRAVFLAKRKGIDAVAINATSVSRRYGFSTMFRECFAKTLAVFDSFLGRKPKFLGEQIIIGKDPIVRSGNASLMKNK